MAWTNITANVAGGQPYYSINNVGSLTFMTGIETDYCFVSSAYNGTTWAASNNLGVQSSTAHVRVSYNKSGSYSGIKIRITYISNGENNYDYAIFGNSGYTLSTAATYNTTGVLYHARGASSTDPVTIEYVLTATTSFDIMYRKDGSTNSGWDRLLFTFEVDAYNPGGGGGSYYYWVGTCIAVSGYTTNSATTAYRLSNSQLSGATMNAFFLGVTTFEPAQRIQVNTDKIAVWISGTTDNISTSLWSNGGTGWTSVGVIQNGHATDYFQCRGLAYYGTTQSAARRSYTLVTGSTYYNQIIKLRQNLFKVIVYGDSNTGHTKAFYNVSFGGSINAVAKTGSLGYISILSSAQTTSCPIVISRTGSVDYDSDCQANYECWRQPWGNDQLATKNTLSEIGVSTSLSDYQVLTYSNQSGIYYMDSPSTGANKCVQLHAVRYKGASSYYRDDTLYAPTTSTGSVVCEGFHVQMLSNEYPLNPTNNSLHGHCSVNHTGLVTIQRALGRVKITHFQPGHAESYVYIVYRIYDNSSLTNIVYSSDIYPINSVNAYITVEVPSFSVVSSSPYIYLIIQTWTDTGSEYSVQWQSTGGSTGTWEIPYTVTY